VIVAVSDRLSRDGFEDQDDHQRGVVGTLTSPTARVAVKSARGGMVGIGAFVYHPGEPQIRGMPRGDRGRGGRDHVAHRPHEGDPVREPAAKESTP
jgi:hypothetical protein